jgi:hypothetical protein
MIRDLNTADRGKSRLPSGSAAVRIGNRDSRHDEGAK